MQPWDTWNRDDGKWISGASTTISMDFDVNLILVINNMFRGFSSLFFSIGFITVPFFAKIEIG